MKSVIIGSGFGGIAAALRLKAKGHDVTLVEKHSDLGGELECLREMVLNSMVVRLLLLPHI